eukprot:358700-Amphidinium_carterae.1
MATSRQSAESSATQSWALAIREGHRVLRVAEKLLSKAWIAPCPLPTDTGARQLSSEEVERFMDLQIMALHWSGPPDTAPTSALLLIPEAASHGITDTLAKEVECFNPDGEGVEMANVVVVLATADYLSRILYEGTPWEAEVVNFVTDSPSAAPHPPTVFASIALPESLESGFWLHLGEDSSLRYLSGGAVSDGFYVSALEEELPEQPSLLFTEVLGSHQTTRRVTGKQQRRPSVAGISGGAANAKSLAAMLGGKAAAPTPASKSKPAPKAPAEKELLTQLLGAVTALGERMSVLETAQQPPRPPSTSRPATSSAAAAAPSPHQAIAAQPGFLPTSSVGQALMGNQGPSVGGRMPSMIGVPPMQQGGMASYEQSLGEARRLLALPD